MIASGHEADTFIAVTNAYLFTRSRNLAMPGDKVARLGHLSKRRFKESFNCSKNSPFRFRRAGGNEARISLQNRRWFQMSFMILHDVLSLRWTKFIANQRAAVLQT